MNISKIEKINNDLSRVDLVCVADVIANKKYKVTFEIDGRCNLFLNVVKASGFSKKITRLSQVTEGDYSYVIMPPFDGKLQFEVHDPDGDLKKWEYISNICIEEI